MIPNSIFVVSETRRQGKWTQRYKLSGTLNPRGRKLRIVRSKSGKVIARYPWIINVFGYVHHYAHHSPDSIRKKWIFAERKLLNRYKKSL